VSSTAGLWLAAGDGCVKYRRQHHENLLSFTGSQDVELQANRVNNKQSFI